MKKLIKAMAIILIIFIGFSFAGCINKNNGNKESFTETNINTGPVTNLSLRYTLEKITVVENNFLFQENTYTNKIFINVKNENDISKNINSNKIEVYYQFNNRTDGVKIVNDFKFNESDYILNIGAKSSSTFFITYNLSKENYNSYKSLRLIIKYDGTTIVKSN